MPPAKRPLTLDPFCGGNGMTAIANLGITGIGIDIDRITAMQRERNWALEELV